MKRRLDVELEVCDVCTYCFNNRSFRCLYDMYLYIFSHEI